VFNDLQRRAESGDTNAMCELAVAYMQNESFEEGFYWFEKAAEAGNSDAQGWLACFYRDEGNFKSAFHYSKLAANNGNVEEQHNLAIHYRDGVGVSANPQKQFYWFEQAVKNGDTSAFNDLGLCYYKGIGTAQNYNQAFSLFEQASNSGDTEGKVSLGACFYHGLGVSENKERAFQLWREAASRGSRTASENLRIFGGGSGSKKGGCYVATCVYGSYDCPEVWTLRRFRDMYLSNSWFGRCFIKLYYIISPRVVAVFGKAKWFNKLWKPILDKLVVKLRKKGFYSNCYFGE